MIKKLIVSILISLGLISIYFLGKAFLPLSSFEGFFAGLLCGILGSIITEILE